jgi:hypothetical protein
MPPTMNHGHDADYVREEPVVNRIREVMDEHSSKLALNPRPGVGRSGDSAHRSFNFPKETRGHLRRPRAVPLQSLGKLGVRD